MHCFIYEICQKYDSAAILRMSMGTISVISPPNFTFDSSIEAHYLSEKVPKKIE